MKKFMLPELRIEKKIFNNKIYQLLSKDKPSALISEKPFLLEDEEGNRIIITRKGSKIDESYDYILLSDMMPTVERLENNSLKIEWYKHPLFDESFKKNEVLDSWNNSFDFIEENLDKKVYGLRAPQIGAVYSVLSHWRVSENIGTVVMPTGTGKTETMISLLVSEKCNTLLVTVPTNALREQISEKFIGFGILKEFGIISEEAKYPIVGVINKRFKTAKELKDFGNKCNVIVTTMSIITGSEVSIQKELSNLCSHYFIDEAHHVKANTWNRFIDFFNPSKIIQFTATPFRNDGKRMDGDIIFNYPLKKAQQEGYFKKINFHPIYEYDDNISDQRLAEEAVSILKKDIQNNKNHILMARCKSKKRANKINEIYKKYSQYNPRVIYSSMSESKKNETKEQLISGKTRIIVCVDMLGEGFDLPNLKIAVFHDVKQSLPITLQLAGRFTRTKYDEELGDATFIANLADISVKEELEELYSQDSDWNFLLSQLSAQQINDEIEFTKLIDGFENLSKNLPLQNLRPPLSTVVYKNPNKKWFPSEFRRGLNISKDNIVTHDINNSDNILVLVIGKKQDVDWGIFKEIQNVTWDLIVVYWDKKSDLLFIHSSDKNSLYQNLADVMIGEKAERVYRMDVFKAFYNINRIRLHNVGLKEFLGRNIRFRMSVGADVEDALSIEEKKKGQKAFVYGVGYENGEKVSLGCSYKGRIWTRLTGDLKEFTNWCAAIGQKLIDMDIDPNQLLKETLIPEYISEIPDRLAYFIDWNEEIYTMLETKIKFTSGVTEKYLYQTELRIDNCQDEQGICFYLELDSDKIIPLKLHLFDNEGVPDYKIELLDSTYANTFVSLGSREYKLTEFFYLFVPVIWFVDGSSLEGNEFIELKQQITPYNREEIVVWDWDGVDLAKESQGVDPKIKDSIQYYMLNKLKNEDYDIIYDDDGRGEIADIITIREDDQEIVIELYHLKYSIGGSVNRRIDNLYEVC